MLTSYKNVPGIFCGLFQSANWLVKNFVKPLGKWPICFANMQKKTTFNLGKDYMVNGD